MLNQAQIDCLKQWVGIRSVSTPGSEDNLESALLQMMSDWQAMGLSCQHRQVNKRVGWLVIDTCPGQAPQCQLSGHFDTVPAAAEHWSQSPWELTRHGDRLTGLGATDMKGFFACAMPSLLHAKNHNIPVRVLITSDEESGMHAIQAAVEHGDVGDVPTVVGEPTSGKKHYGNKGIGLWELEIRGRSGHSSQVDESPVATDGLASLLGACQALRLQWRQQLDVRFSPPYTTLNIGMIHAGDSFNRIAPSVKLTIDVRPIPEFASKQYAQIDQMLESISTSGVDIMVHNQVQVPGSVHQAAPSEGLLAPFATEAGFFPNHGANVLIWGPGELDQAHQVDESISINTMHTYSQQLLQWVSYASV